MKLCSSISISDRIPLGGFGESNKCFLKVELGRLLVGWVVIRNEESMALLCET